MSKLFQHGPFKADVLLAWANLYTQDLKSPRWKWCFRLWNNNQPPLFLYISPVIPGHSYTDFFSVHLVNLSYCSSGSSLRLFKHLNKPRTQSWLLLWQFLSVPSPDVPAGGKFIFWNSFNDWINFFILKRVGGRRPLKIHILCSYKIIFMRGFAVKDKIFLAKVVMKNILRHRQMD